MFGLASNLRGRDLLPSLYVKIRDVLHVVHGRTTEYYHGKILDGLRSDSLFMSNYPYRRLGQDDGVFECGNGSPAHLAPVLVPSPDRWESRKGTLTIKSVQRRERGKVRVGMRVFGERKAYLLLKEEHSFYRQR
ncbi:uncharacterized protein LOC131303800 isoform X1 [Rhododendron vialii]|uniref:uncharacterized protein LOC131303800 isoform X1 n=1 Tax=Rhododendron vialii TaxID=182163 RepID=UPI00265DD682|nr:uncharacterized protein LOC131303800 isoform X1 [Rhododendron vialii]